GQRPGAGAEDAGRLLAHVADRCDLRHSWSSLLDPDLAHERVELSAPDVVPDALRDEVDQAGVEEHGLSGVVRGRLVDLRPQLERGRRILDAELERLLTVGSDLLVDVARNVDARVAAGMERAAAEQDVEEVRRGRVVLVPLR